MLKITNLSNSYSIEDDSQRIYFAKGKTIFIAENDSDSITLRLIGSRKNIMTFSCKEIGYDNAAEAVEYLSTIAN